jgi:hypothetical protein
MVIFGDVLMDGIVRKTSQRKPPARKKNLNFIGRGKFLDAIKDVGGLFPG